MTRLSVAVPVLVVLLAGCGGDESSGEPEEPRLPPRQAAEQFFGEVLDEDDAAAGEYAVSGEAYASCASAVGQEEAADRSFEGYPSGWSFSLGDTDPQGRVTVGISSPDAAGTVVVELEEVDDRWKATGCVLG